MNPLLHRRSVLFAGVVLAAISSLLVACDDTVIDPFDNDAKYFSVFGYLDPQADEQAVRVIPVTRFPERIRHPNDSQAKIDAVVTSTNLRSGETERWEHSLEQLSDGNWAHVYRADFHVLAGQPYELTVTRSDGKTATARTRVPFISNSSPLAFSPDSALARLDRGGFDRRQSIRIAGIESPWGITARFWIASIFDFRGETENRFEFVEIPIGRPGARTDDGDWQFTFDWADVGARLSARIAELQEAGLLGNTSLVVESMQFRIQVLDSDWFLPEGNLDLEVLGQPGSLSNVENGFGFFGSVGLVLQDYPLGASYHRLLGI